MINKHHLRFTRTVGLEKYGLTFQITNSSVLFLALMMRCYPRLALPTANGWIYGQDLGKHYCVGESFGEGRQTC